MLAERQIHLQNLWENEEMNSFRHNLSQYMNSQGEAEYSTVSPASHRGNLCLQVPIAPLRKINTHTLRWQGIMLWWMQNSYNFKMGAAGE